MRFVSTFVILVTLVLSTKTVFASLLISPQRIFFEPRERMQEMVLLNNGREEMSYRISWEELKQTENGSYETISSEQDDGSILKASDYIRFSPRQVRLKPGESQPIKFVVRRSAGMRKGEYRSHVKFNALPRAPKEMHNAGEMAFDLQVLTSFVVPVILREGEGQSRFTIDEVSVVPNTQNSPQYGNIEVNWSRQGNFGAVGQLNAAFKASGQTEFESVGLLNGVNFFVDRETLKTSIVWPEQPISKEGILKISFVDQYSNKGATLAEREFRVTLP